MSTGMSIRTAAVRRTSENALEFIEKDEKENESARISQSDKGIRSGENA
jgi:hypothetical protein